MYTQTLALSPDRTLMELPAMLITLTLFSGLAAATVGVAQVIPYPSIDPIALQLGPIAIRWYGLAYMTGLLLGWIGVRRMLTNDALWNGTAPLDEDDADTLLIWMTIGIVLGGRLGFVFLYEPGYFLANPSQVFAVWNGGMAFHGAVIGVALAIIIFAWMRGVNFLTISDLVTAVAPIGLFFGRIANFINAEVVGRVTDMPWAMVFPPPDGGPEPRHPSQLYEAFLEGLVLYVVLRYLVYSRRALRWPGYVTGVFLIGYALARIFSEFFREYDPSQYFTFGPYLTSGMVYSIPMLIIGLIILRSARFRGETAALDET